MVNTLAWEGEKHLINHITNMAELEDATADFEVRRF
jgi:hypothetical protein